VFILRNENAFTDPAYYEYPMISSFFPIKVEMEDFWPGKV